MLEKIEDYFDVDKVIIGIFALFAYGLFIAVLTVDNLSPVICFILTVIAMFFSFVALGDYLDKADRRSYYSSFLDDVKVILIELVKFVLVLFVAWFIWYLFIEILYKTQLVDFSKVSNGVTQAANESNLLAHPKSFILIAVIFGPIVEEYVFRFLPRYFLNNKWVYIIISTVIFAGVHVVGDPWAWLYIAIYILRSWYFAYAYYKTEDLKVPIVLHMFLNLTAIISILYF